MQRYQHNIHHNLRNFLQSNKSIKLLHIFLCENKIANHNNYSKTIYGIMQIYEQYVILH